VLGLGPPALEVLHEPEQALGPADAAPVADIVEGGARLQQPLLGARQVALLEGDPRQVPQRPRLLPPGAQRAEHLQRPTDGGLGRLGLAAEQARHPAQAQRLGLARGVAQLPPGLDGLVERRGRPRQVALGLLDVALHGERLGPRLRVHAALDLVPHLVEVAAGAVEVVQLRPGPGPLQQHAPSWPARSRRQQAQGTVEERNGHRVHVALLGPYGGALDGVQRDVADVGGDAADGAQLLGQLGGGAVVVG
jgi:hypothetical protein